MRTTGSAISADSVYVYRTEKSGGKMDEENRETEDLGQEDEEAQQPQDDVEGDGEQPTTGARTYTEEEFQKLLNRIVPERAQQAQRSLLKELGYEEPSEIKKDLAALKKIRLEQMSEQERQEALLKEYEQRAERAEKERDQAVAEGQDRMLRAAFLAEAGRRGAKHPGDAFMLADLSLVRVDGDDVEGVEDAVQALIDDGRLVLSGKQQAPSLNGGAGSGDRPGKKVRLSPEELATAQKMGVSPEDYAKFKQEK